MTTAENQAVSEVGRRDAAAPSLLGLAATPVFAAMALLTWAQGGDADMICSVLHTGSALGGMAPMYLLMSTFHSAPWLKLILRR
jgi:hypothetical protein